MFGLITASLAMVICACDCGLDSDPATALTTTEATPVKSTSPPQTSGNRSVTTQPAHTSREGRAQLALLNPKLATEESPETYRIRFETTQGPFVVQVQRQWALRGADRLYNLVKIGYFSDMAFFRAIDGFMVQFGVNADPAVNRVWNATRILDDRVLKSNTRGTVTFATSGKNSRTTQLFINYADNSGLDRQGFAPVGEVVQGMGVVDSIHTGYGDAPPGGSGPSQARIQEEGNVYLRANFPDLDYIRSAAIVEE